MFGLELGVRRHQAFGPGAALLQQIVAQRAPKLFFEADPPRLRTLAVSFEDLIVEISDFDVRHARQSSIATLAKQ